MSGGHDGVAIGVDIGTSGVRAALVDGDGAMLAMGSARLAEECRREPEAWWAALSAALADLPGRGAARALAVDGTSGTVLPVDAAGAPLCIASMYNDRADPALAALVGAAAPPESGAHGAASPLAKLLAMQDAAGIKRMLHQADWVAGRLCGRFDTTDENNALKTGYDPVARAWPGWLDGVGARTTLLPRVVAPGTPVGRIDAAQATALGLSPDLLVVAGTTDGCAAFLATGAAETGEGVSSLGSTLTLKQLSDRPLFAPEYGVYSHRLGDRWLAGGASNSGGAALARYFDGAALAALSARLDPSVASDLDYYPLPAPGERFPIADPALAPREAPRPADDVAFLHGLLEGIARIEALGYRRLADLGGPALTGVRSVGGGARNPVWTAIRARVLGVALAPARSEEAAVGTAGLALAGLRVTARA